MRFSESLTLLYIVDPPLAPVNNIMIYLFFVFRTKLHLILCIQVTRTHKHTTYCYILFKNARYFIIIIIHRHFGKHTKSKTKNGLRPGKLDERDEKTRKNVRADVNFSRRPLVQITRYTRTNIKRFSRKPVLTNNHALWV